jgi:hypothetical protein
VQYPAKPQAEKSANSVVLELLRQRASIREFTNTPVPGTPAGTVVVRAADLLVRDGWTVTAGNARHPRRDTRAAKVSGHAWSRWRRRHQARARWHHYPARLQAAAA